MELLSAIAGRARGRGIMSRTGLSSTVLPPSHQLEFGKAHFDGLPGFVSGNNNQHLNSVVSGESAYN